MGYFKKVKVTDALGEREEEHRIEVCSKCKSEIDNSVTGYFGHSKMPELILCEACYQELVSKGKWDKEGVKI